LSDSVVSFILSAPKQYAHVCALSFSFFYPKHISIQIIVSIRRGSLLVYITDSWNLLEWLTLAVYLSGMLTKLGSGQTYRDASKTLLTLTFMLMCGGFLKPLTLSDGIGAKLVMIKTMVKY
jgi:hypothetical protein